MMNLYEEIGEVTDRHVSDPNTGSYIRLFETRFSYKS